MSSLEKIRSLPIELQQLIYEFDDTYKNIYSENIVTYIKKMFNENTNLLFKLKYQGLFGNTAYFVYEKNFDEFARVVSCYERFDTLPNSILLKLYQVPLIMKIDGKQYYNTSDVKRMRDYLMLTQNLYYDEFDDLD